MDEYGSGSTKRVGISGVFAGSPSDADEFAASAFVSFADETVGLAALAEVVTVSEFDCVEHAAKTGPIKTRKTTTMCLLTRQLWHAN